MKPILPKFYRVVLLAVGLIAGATTVAQTETEPNNTAATANNLPQAASVTGTVGAPGDTEDYFRALPNDDGTLKITLQYTNSGGGTHPGIFLYVYNKNQGQIGTKFIYSVPVGTYTDSLKLHCRANDTMFFRLNASQSIGYSMSFLMTPSGTADAEPNNSFTQATFVPHSTTTSGRIYYTGTITDNDDYFKAYLPAGGTFKLYTNYNNTSGSTGSGLFAYVLNKNQSQIGNKFLYNRPLGASPTDTITLHCREQDTVFIRYNANGCFSYTFSYEVINQHPSDAEPNNAFAQASYFAPPDTIKGRIGYNTTVTDNNDYFKTYMPNGGTFKLYTTYNNTSGTPSAGLFIYVHNSGQAQIGNKFLYNRPLGVNPTDTLTIHCRDVDTIFVRVNSSGCFAYSMTHEIIPPGPNDSEPNNAFAQAQLIQPNTNTVGRIGHIGALNDANDYFKTYLPAGGTFKLYTTYNNSSGSTSSGFFAYVHNKNQSQIGTKFLYNRPLGVSPTDTITIHCREQDTLYIRYNTSGCFSYNFWYEVVNQHPNDAEPNNAFGQATYFAPTDTVFGRIGYNTTSADNDDYFKTYMPDGGTFKLYTNYNNTSGSASSGLFIYVYNKNQSQIGYKFLYNRPLGSNPTDTITVHCREQDTIYVRYNNSGCFSYNFFYEVLNHGPNDIEPNNTLATAQLIDLTTTLHGRVNYTTTTTDNTDYFKFYNPSQSNLTIYLEANNTSGSNNGAFYFYAYRSNGNQIFYKPLTGLATGVRLDTIQINCLLQDTIYLRVIGSGCFSYKMDFLKGDAQPVAHINHSRMGNTFGFVADVKNTDQVTWNFGDGTTSNLRLPVKDFGIGSYHVVLEAKNTACNLTARDTFDIDVVGIEYFTPTRAGSADNIGFVNLRIFGGGLDTLADVTLTLGGTVLRPFQKGSPSRSELNLLFDLKDAPFGFYDVDIALSGGTSYSYPGALEVFQDKPGFDIVATVSGPSLVRTNQWNNYKLTVTNDRARLANSVVAVVVVPEGVETNIRDIILKRTGQLKIDEAAYANLTIPLDYFSGTYFDNKFNPKTDTMTVNYDSVYTYVDSLVGIKIDTLFDAPYRGTAYHLLIPMIAGEGSYNINFKVRSSSNGNRKIFAYAHPQNLRQNPVSGETLDWIHEGGMQAAALAEFAPNPALQAVGKSAGYVDIGSKVAFTEFFDWYYGVNNADADFYAEQSISLGAEVAGEFVPYGKKFESGRAQAKFTQNRMKNATKHIKLTEEIIMNSGLSPTMAGRLFKDLDYFRNFLEGAGKNLTQIQKQAQMDAIKQYFSKKGINLTTNQLNNLLFPDDVTTNKPKQIESKDQNSVTSFDPNEIYGPQGFGQNRYLKAGSAMPYVVTFENVDTALAPAQVVRVALQLDPTVFDVKRTTLGDVSIGENTYFFEANRQTFFRDIDLRPANNVIVRVNANVDTLTGNIAWLFTSLDPATMDVLTDPLGGFLPPNVTFPEGEGSVSFITYPLQSVTQSDTLACFADIYFDQNEPIVTGTWKNNIDETSPATSLSPTATIENGNVMVLGLNGSDNESGLESYWLHFKIGSGNWNTNPLPVLFGTEMRIEGTVGETYQFYIIGRDSTGNEEIKSPIAETTVTLMSQESTFDPSFSLYPNPANNVFYARPNGNFADVEVVIYSITGQAVFKSTEDFTSGTDREIKLPTLRQGAYLVHFTNKAGKTNVQKLLIVKVN